MSHHSQNPTPTRQRSLRRTAQSGLLVPPSELRRVYSEHSVGRNASNLSIDQNPSPEHRHPDTGFVQMQLVPLTEQQFIEAEKRKRDRAKITARKMFDKLMVLMRGRKDPGFRPLSRASRGRKKTREERIGF